PAAVRPITSPIGALIDACLDMETPPRCRSAALDRCRSDEVRSPPSNRSDGRVRTALRRRLALQPLEQLPGAALDPVVQQLPVLADRPDGRPRQRDGPAVGRGAEDAVVPARDPPARGD